MYSGEPLHDTGILHLPGTRLTGPWLAVAPILFLAHDLEEAFQARRMNVLVAELGPRLPAPLARRLLHVRYSTKAVAAVGAGAFAAQVALTAASRRHRRARLLLKGLLVARSANAMMHVAESLLARRYVLSSPPPAFQFGSG